RPLGLAGDNAARRDRARHQRCPTNWPESAVAIAPSVVVSSVSHWIMSRTYFACFAESTTTARIGGGTTPSFGSGEVVRAKWHEIGQVSEITLAPAVSIGRSSPASSAMRRTARLVVTHNSVLPW